jgi:hypothetical protein
MIPPIYEDSRGKIQINVDIATDQCVVHLVVKRTGAIVGKFSFPERAGYETLTKVDNNYSGYITKEMTLGYTEEVLRLDFAAFVGNFTKRQGQTDITNIKPTSTASIEKV